MKISLYDWCGVQSDGGERAGRGPPAGPLLELHKPDVSGFLRDYFIVHKITSRKVEKFSKYLIDVNLTRQIGIQVCTASNAILYSKLLVYLCCLLFSGRPSADGPLVIVLPRLDS